MTKGNYYSKPLDAEKVRERAERLIADIDDGAHFILVKTADLPELFKSDMKTLLGVSADDMISGVSVTSDEYILSDDFTVVKLPEAANPDECAGIFFRYAITANLDSFYCTCGEYGSMALREFVPKLKRIFVIDYLIDNVPCAYVNGISVLFLGNEWADEREDKMSHVGFAIANGENADAGFDDWETVRV